MRKMLTWRYNEEKTVSVWEGIQTWETVSKGMPELDLISEKEVQQFFKDINCSIENIGFGSWGTTQDCGYLEEKERLFAFWKHTDYNYGTVLGGEVEEIFPSGKVRTKSFSSMIFDPIAILPYEEGFHAYEKIKSDEWAMEKERKQRAKNHKALIENLLNLKNKVL